jgi:hypothetical protein
LNFCEYHMQGGVVRRRTVGSSNTCIAEDIINEFPM